MATQPKKTARKQPAIKVQNVSDIANESGSIAGPRHAADDIGSDNETFGRTDDSRTLASPPLDEDDPIDLASGPDQVPINNGAFIRHDEGADGSTAARHEHPQGPTIRLTGYQAIEYAEKQNLMLNKHPDKITGPRVNLTVAEAEAIADEDPELIWVDVPKEQYYTGPPSSFEPDY